MRAESFETPQGLIKRALVWALSNPKTTVAGLAAIAAACVPEKTAQISAIAAGIGLVLAGDAK